MADEMTMQAIADQLGCSRQNIDQVIKKVFAKIRRRLRSMQINSYADLSISDALVDGIRAGNRPRTD